MLAWQSPARAGQSWVHYSISLAKYGIHNLYFPEFFLPVLAQESPASSSSFKPAIDPAVRFLCHDTAAGQSRTSSVSGNGCLRIIGQRQASRSSCLLDKVHRPDRPCSASAQPGGRRHTAPSVCQRRPLFRTDGCPAGRSSPRSRLPSGSRQTIGKTAPQDKWPAPDRLQHTQAQLSPLPHRPGAPHPLLRQMAAGMKPGIQAPPAPSSVPRQTPSIPYRPETCPSPLPLSAKQLPRLCTTVCTGGRLDSMFCSGDGIAAPDQELGGGGSGLHAPALNGHHVEMILHQRASVDSRFRRWSRQSAPGWKAKRM